MDRGHDADWFRDAVEDKGRLACTAGHKRRNQFEMPVAATPGIVEHLRKRQVDMIPVFWRDWQLLGAGVQEAAARDKAMALQAGGVPPRQ